MLTSRISRVRTTAVAWEWKRENSFVDLQRFGIVAGSLALLLLKCRKFWASIPHPKPYRQSDDRWGSHINIFHPHTRKNSTHTHIPQLSKHTSAHDDVTSFFRPSGAHHRRNTRMRVYPLQPKHVHWRFVYGFKLCYEWDIKFAWTQLCDERHRRRSTTTTTTSKHLPPKVSHCIQFSSCCWYERVCTA